jgi:hypothetical protein
MLTKCWDDENAPAAMMDEHLRCRVLFKFFQFSVIVYMELGDNNYANYQVLLQTVEGREILRSRASKVRFGKDRAFATLPVEAGKLALW